VKQASPKADMLVINEFDQLGNIFIGGSSIANSIWAAFAANDNQALRIAA